MHLGGLHGIDSVAMAVGPTVDTSIQFARAQKGVLDQLKLWRLCATALPDVRAATRGRPCRAVRPPHRHAEPGRQSGWGERGAVGEYGHGISVSHSLCSWA